MHYDFVEVTQEEIRRQEREAKLEEDYGKMPRGMRRHIGQWKCGWDHLGESHCGYVVWVAEASPAYGSLPARPRRYIVEAEGSKFLQEIHFRRS